jgi:hypothetical protein
MTLAIGRSRLQIDAGHDLAGASLMPEWSPSGIAIAVLLSAIVPARAADPLSPQASAFKEDGKADCISNFVYRGIAYAEAERQCECVFDFYARRLTPSEMSNVAAMSKLLRAEQPGRSDPVVIAGANALMRVNPEMMQSCNIK